MEPSHPYVCVLDTGHPFCSSITGTLWGCRNAQSQWCSHLPHKLQILIWSPFCKEQNNCKANFKLILSRSPGQFHTIMATCGQQGEICNSMKFNKPQLTTTHYTLHTPHFILHITHYTFHIKYYTLHTSY